MNAFQSRAAALVVASAMWGCAPMPTLQPPEKAAAVIHNMADPFEFKTERESTDVADAAANAAALPFDLAVRLSLRHSPSVQAALARVRLAQAEAEQVRLWPNPVLALAVKFPTGGGTPDIEATVAADLLSLLLKPGRISAADQRLRKSVADSLVVVLDVLADVRRQYAQAQALAAQVGIDQARHDILNDLLRLTEARIRGGEAPRLDALTLQSQTAALETDLLSRRSDERQARLELARLIGEPSSPATWTLDTWAAPVLVSADESALLKIALERRPELQSIVWELAALGQEMKVARFGTLLDGGDLGLAAERSDGSWTLGPAGTIAIPLFDTGQAQRAAIAARVVEQRHDLTRLERQVVQDVRIAFEQLRSSTAALSQIDQRLIPLQNERLTQATNSYRLGVVDVLAVRFAEQDLQQARSRQVDLQEQVSQATYRLLRAIGGAMPAESPATPANHPTTQTRNNPS